MRFLPTALVRVLALSFLLLPALLPASAHATHCDQQNQCVNPSHLTATVTANPTTVTAGQSITFTAEASDPDFPNATHTFSWQFGAGAQFESGQAQMTRTLPVGTHVVVVRVQDLQNQRETTAQVSVTVTEAAQQPTTPTPTSTPPPTASFAPVSTKLVAAKVLTFDASATKPAPGVSIVKYEWDLNGNGTYETSCTGPAAAVSFGTVGTKPISLRVTDSTGQSSTSSESFRLDTASATRYLSSALKPTASACAGSAGTGVLDGTTPSKDPDCFTTLYTGIAELMAPCFKKTEEHFVGGGSKMSSAMNLVYVAAGKVRLNGIDIKPKPGVFVRVDTYYRKVSTQGGSATASMYSGATLGNLTFHNGPINWNLPSGKSARFNLGYVSITKGAQLFGLNVEGDASLDLVHRGAELPITMHIPKPLDVSAKVKLRTDNMKGLRLDDVRLQVTNAKFGAFDVKNLDLYYSAEMARFDGTAELYMTSVGNIKVQAQIVGKTLTLFSANLDLVPPLAMGSGVFLQHVHFNYTAGPPLTLLGGIRLTAGPPVKGKSAASIDGTLKYVASDPWLLRADGNASLVGVGMAKAYVEYRSNGMFRMGGSADGTFYDIVSASGQVGFWLYAPTQQFNAEGSVKVCVWKGCGGGAIIVSNVGIGGCVYTVFADFGMGYKWGGSVKYFLTGCDIGTWRSHWTGDHLSKTHMRSRPKAEAVRSEDVQITGNQRAAFIRVAGAGAPPRVKVTGPDGTTIVTPEGSENYIQTRTYNLLQIPPHNATYVMVAKPKAGRWRIEAMEGSVGIVGVHGADALPKPKVSATVGGIGYRRAVNWSVDPQPGQVVKIVERAGDVSRTLVTTRGGRGVTPFTPADGKAGRRSIIALVEQDGLPRRNIVLTTYAAPGPVLPARPTKLKIVRTARAATATWQAVSGARRYHVVATVSDGRRISITTTKRSLKLTDVVRTKTVRLTVRGLRADGRPGAAAVAPAPGR